MLIQDRADDVEAIIRIFPDYLLYKEEVADPLLLVNKTSSFHAEFRFRKMNSSAHSPTGVRVWSTRGRPKRKVASSCSILRTCARPDKSASKFIKLTDFADQLLTLCMVNVHLWSVLN